MKQQLKQFFLLAFLGVVIGLTSASYANSADLTEPQMAIENASNKLQEQLQDKAFTQDFAKINLFVEDVIEPHMDFGRISALVLGKLWRKASKDEKTSFKKEFKILLVRTYSRAFVGFKDWSVRYLPLKIAKGTKKIIVKTEILQPGIQPLAVNYRMLLTKGKWKVYDIMIEGVSLVTNYRISIKTEFKKKGSLKAVIDGLATRNVAALKPKSHS